MSSPDLGSGTAAAMEFDPKDLEKITNHLADYIGPLAKVLVRKTSQQAADLGPGPFLADLRACDRFDVMDRVGGIRVPTLALVGTDDVMTPPKYSEYLRDHMPDASVEIFAGGTHFVFAEYPDAVNRAIAGFVASLGGPA